MTNDPVQRTELSTWINLSRIFAKLHLMILTPKLVFDASDAVSAKGFVIAAVLYAIISNIGFRLCYNMTTEKIVNEVKEDVLKVSLEETLKTLVKNRALIGLIISTLDTLTANFITGALMHIYLKITSKHQEC